ncbi:hypothetical protein COCON_G00069160 [Conger conger]|uniref:Uncharacterized protein n=1 Tax=Conger conger TaxID=82655 RepID=A0A9Q1DSY8_CONCO|nr:hypothetical protein COCON_G00069160 [Conger conger]
MTDVGVICSVLTAETVISQLKVSLLIPSGTGDQEVEAALYNASLALEAYLKNKFSAINSFRIRKFIKPKKHNLTMRNHGESGTGGKKEN